MEIIHMGIKTNLPINPFNKSSSSFQLTCLQWADTLIIKYPNIYTGKGTFSKEPNEELPLAARQLVGLETLKLSPFSLLLQGQKPKL